MINVDKSISEVRLYNFLEKYYTAITSYINMQTKEEYALGKSTSQYLYILLSYSYKYANIISYLIRFDTYESVYNSLKVKQLTNVLATKGINFNDILAIYNLPKVDMDDVLIDTSIIGNSPIANLIEQMNTTTINSNINLDVDPIPFTLYMALSDTPTITSSIELFQLSSIGLYEALGNLFLEYPDFMNQHPVIAIPSNITMNHLYEVSTQHDIKGGFILNPNPIEIAGRMYNVFIYYTPTLSDIDNKLVIQLNYMRS